MLKNLGRSQTPPTCLFYFYLQKLSLACSSTCANIEPGMLRHVALIQDQTPSKQIILSKAIQIQLWKHTNKTMCNNQCVNFFTNICYDRTPTCINPLSKKPVLTICISEPIWGLPCWVYLLPCCFSFFSFQFGSL